MNEDYLEFLCWIDRCLFPVDLAEDLKKLGLRNTTAAYYEVEWKYWPSDGNTLTILRLYQNYCIGRKLTEEDNDVGYYLQKWIDKQYQTWQTWQSYNDRSI